VRPAARLSPRSLSAGAAGSQQAGRTNRRSAIGHLRAIEKNLEDRRRYPRLALLTIPPSGKHNGSEEIVEDS
jgi:hypothetical protein